MLNEVGFDNVALHGMIPQKERLASLARFKSNIARILVATDVASRGLDIPTVELVINHTMPSSATIYIHRVGRTARAGRGGTAISLVTPHDIALLQAVEQHINTKLTEFPINGKEVAKIFTQVSVTKREAEIKLDQGDFEERKKINKRKKLILEGKDPDEEERKIEEEKKRLRKQLKLLQKRKLQKKQKEIRQFMKDNVDEKS